MLQNSIYIEIMFISIAVSVFLLVKVKSGVFRLVHQKLFSQVLGLVVLSSSLDFLSTALDGQQFMMADVFNGISYAFYFASSAVMSFCWLRFSGYAMNFSFWKDKKKLTLLSIPMAVSVFVSVMSLWTGWVFQLDDFNYYHRGPLYMVAVLGSYFYMALSMVLAFYKAAFKRNFADRDLYFSIASLGLLPFFAIFLRMLLGDIPTTTPGIALAMLLTFATMQARMITLDPLTRMNNRSQLNVYLTGKMDDSEDNGRLYRVSLKISKFKKICDIYGHAEGDNALCLVANVLKSICGPRGFFMSRICRDEFVIVADLENDDAVKELCDAIRANLEKKAIGLPYKIRLDVQKSKL